MTSQTLSNDAVIKIFYPESYEHFGNKKGHIRSALSRTKAYINKYLPKGTLLMSTTSKEDVTFTFVTADNKQSAHAILVSTGVTGLNTIDKLVATMRLPENTK